MLQGIGNLVAEDGQLNREERETLNEIVAYLIQNIGYGSSPPKAVVLSLVKSMKGNAISSPVVSEACQTLKIMVENGYMPN